MMTTAVSLLDILKRGEPVTAQRPWPRTIVSSDAWNTLIEGLASGVFTLLGLWGEADMVHLAAHDEAKGELGVASLACPTGRFPSVGRLHPPAIRLERALTDLCGLSAEGSPDN